MKNRILKLLLSSLTVIGLLTLTACSTDNKETTTHVEQSIDSSFINDLEIEIQNRWDYNDGTASGEIEIDSNTEYLETLLSFEQNLYKYADEEFDNPRLKALALDYIKGLKLQEEAIPFYDIDYSKYDDLWLKGFDLRSTTLLSLSAK